MTFEQMARANKWEITLNSRDQYVAHDTSVNDSDPVYILDADTEEEAWEELCKEEGITFNGFGHCIPVN